ncbi:HAMP domain-containing histidine kinase [Diaminobutyricibacter tongyongensis]|uniref:Sensor histidine kinase MtrB n=1 Tax=Leifsonia tongyongensis TaxID=1268043 RepID=A0A6L9Y087_9MICO|nr:MtrAB system histidine kinase MtrB [Diaminobutyricibacter tongyongensis]NEN07050.1 HAMP domain-containing histidine kinase [Diaminobutyricibacter tongyongensis]
MGWRQWWTAAGSRLAHLWRTSLQVRTVTITLALTGIAILVTGIYMSLSIANDLYQSRLDQALRDSSRATTAAQTTLNASDITGGDSVRNLLDSALRTASTSSSSRLIAAFRVPGQEPTFLAPADRLSPGLSGDVISKELRTAVQHGGTKQFYQSVKLVSASGSSDPGIVVGSQLTLPVVGHYELYIGYDLSDAESTLVFVQNTLLLAGLALILLIGAVTWVIVRFVVRPIRVAAQTSERLAAGDLAVRMPEKGEDVFTSLARSFNGMADSLQSQINQLATLSQLQQRFVSDVSHELRTPLTTIRLAGDVIYDQRESFPPATERTAELLHTQIERFDLLLSDLLEISRYDAGSVVLDPEPTNLVRLAEDAIDGMHTLAEQNGSELRLEAPGGYFEVGMDPRRIRRIVRNLLGNAIEHGEGKPVVVMVDSNESAVALSVRDYGLGMNQQEVNHVFDRFWRADPSRKRTIGGTGLGLAISLEDATLHSGWLQVWSAPGAGSCFRLTLPRVPGRGIASSPLPLPPEDAATAGDAGDRSGRSASPGDTTAGGTAAGGARASGDRGRPTDSEAVEKAEAEVHP